MPVLAVCILLFSACGGDSDADDNPNTSNETNESDIVSHMDLVESEARWTFTTDANETCTVDQVLTTPVDVQSHENDGDVVAVNSAGSAGVVLPADVSDSCHDAAIEMLADF